MTTVLWWFKHRRRIGATAPKLTSISPTSVVHGTGTVSLTCTGSHFVTASSVLSGVTPTTTTFSTIYSVVSPSFPVPSTAGTVQVSVKNPDGQQSSAVTFTAT